MEMGDIEFSPFFVRGHKINHTNAHQECLKVSERTFIMLEDFFCTGFIKNFKRVYVQYL